MSLARALLFVLAAISATWHPPTHGAAATVSPERTAAIDTARWTKWLCIWTAAMTAATAGAVVTPLLVRRKDRGESTKAALRDLYQIVYVFEARTNKLAREPRFAAEALLKGLDVLLSRALADDITRALPNTTETSFVYIALFAGFDAIADAVHWQGSVPVERGNAQDMAVASNVMLKRGMEALTKELKRRKAEWAPSEIATWIGAGH